MRGRRVLGKGFGFGRSLGGSGQGLSCPGEPAAAGGLASVCWNRAPRDKRLSRRSKLFMTKTLPGSVRSSFAWGQGGR